MLLRWILIVAAIYVAAVVTIIWANLAHSAVASWYGPGFEGNRTANGDIFDATSDQCAHPTAPFGTVFRVTYEGRTGWCRVVDRGPFVAGRSFDLSQATAEWLGMLGNGVARVTIELERLPT